MFNSNLQQLIYLHRMFNLKEPNSNLQQGSNRSGDGNANGGARAASQANGMREKWRTRDGMRGTDLRAQCSGGGLAEGRCSPAGSLLSSGGAAAPVAGDLVRGGAKVDRG